MSVIYVKEQGSYIQKMGERIVVSKHGENLLEIPSSNIENIAVIGNVQITSQALYMMLQNGIDVSYFTYGGKYLGQSAAESSKNIFLRFAQYAMYQDEKRRLEMARIIVSHKISNQIEMIKTHRWKPDEKHNWKDDVNQIELLRDKLPDMKTGNEILGIEGMASQIYFGSFGAMFSCEFSFDKRTRRPPRDPINVILSLGYTFLTKDIYAALDAESFEPYLGYLHGIRYGRKSLALDIVEAYRQPVVDRMTLKLFNKQMISKYDFDIDEDRVTLSEEGFKKFCKEYERWMTDQTVSGAEKGYRRIIKSKVSELKKCIQDGTAYEPYIWEV